MYGSIMMSNVAGNNSLHQVGSLLWQTIYACICGALIMGLAILLVPLILKLTSDQDEEEMALLLHSEEVYCTIVLACGLAFLLYDIGSSLFAALDKKIPIYVINLSCMAVNVLADYILVTVLKLGYVGAAIATPLSKLLGALLFFATAFLSPSLRKRCRLLTCASFRPRWRLLWRIWAKGLLVGLVNCLDDLAWTLVLLFAQAAGERCVTATGYCSSLNDVVLLASYGVSAALRTIASALIGAAQPHLAVQATHVALRILFVYGSLAATLYLTLPHYLLKLFIRTDDFASPEQGALLAQESAAILRILSAFLLPDCAAYSLTALLQAAGVTSVSPAATLLGLSTGILAPFLVLKRLNRVTFWVPVLLLVSFGLLRAIPEFIAAFCSKKWQKRTKEIAEREMARTEEAQLQAMEEEEAQAHSNEGLLTHRESAEDDNEEEEEEEEESEEDETEEEEEEEEEEDNTQSLHSHPLAPSLHSMPLSRSTSPAPSLHSALSINTQKRRNDGYTTLDTHPAQSPLHPLHTPLTQRDESETNESEIEEEEEEENEDENEEEEEEEETESLTDDDINRLPEAFHQTFDPRNKLNHPPPPISLKNKRKTRKTD